MTNLIALPQTGNLRLAIDNAVAMHGARRVLFAVLRAVLRPPPRPPRRPTEIALSDHLRRDIGLAPKAAGRPDLTRHF